MNATQSGFLPLATNFCLEIIKARGLPLTEEVGIFPDTYACASLLYEDLWHSGQLPVDHATGDEQSTIKGFNVQDVQSLPFKIIPHVRTQTYSRSVDPTWQGKFTLTETRPSFVVLDGPDYLNKKLFSSERDVPIQGQHVLLLVTIHEEQRFGPHRRMGGVVIELKPGPPVTDWFTLHKRDGTPVPSSTGPGYAAVQLRIAYPGSISDTISFLRIPEAELDILTSSSRTPSVPSFQDHDDSFTSLSHPMASEESFDMKNNERSTTYLEQMARQMFHVNNSGKKSLKAVIPPRTPILQSATQESKKANHRRKGLHMEIVHASNLPKRLAQGHDPSPYSCVSLLILHSLEAKMILSGQAKVSHDLRRDSSSRLASRTSKNVLLMPQCQTRSLAATRYPRWDETLYLGEGTLVGNGHILNSVTLFDHVPKSDDVYLILVSVCDTFEFGSDRLLGACILPILPGQLLVQTLNLRSSDRLEQDATVTVRAFLNIVPAAEQPHGTLESSLLRMVNGGLSACSRRRDSFKADVSDSDSQDEDPGGASERCIETHPLSTDNIKFVLAQDTLLDTRSPDNTLTHPSAATSASIIAANRGCDGAEAEAGATQLIFASDATQLISAHPQPLIYPTCTHTPQTLSSPKVPATQHTGKSHHHLGESAYVVPSSPAVLRPAHPSLLQLRTSSPPRTPTSPTSIPPTVTPLSSPYSRKSSLVPEEKSEGNGPSYTGSTMQTAT
jgi:hypothetical protein